MIKTISKFRSNTLAELNQSSKLLIGNISAMILSHCGYSEIGIITPARRNNDPLMILVNQYGLFRFMPCTEPKKPSNDEIMTTKGIAANNLENKLYLFKATSPTPPSNSISEIETRLAITNFGNKYFLKFGLIETTSSKIPIF